MVSRLALAVAALAIGAAAPVAQPPRPLGGTLPSGARWEAKVPARWNGTLLLWSRGYRPTVPTEIELAPKQTADDLLAAGYALAATSYSRGGWAVEEGEKDGIATLDAFAAKMGKPRRTIAWGGSMGGLVSTALAERHPRRIDGAAPSCASIGGTVGMMNSALDGAFVFKTLLAPASVLRLTGITDDRANGATAQAIVDAAQATPAGRARLALAGVIAGIPGWTDPAKPAPAATDYPAQESQIADSFVKGVFLPRSDSEARAGGNFSWNTGVDYAAQLGKSERGDMVRALYRTAGLDLTKDLVTLAGTPRITADPRAVAYMRANYAPSGRLAVPLLTYQTIGDGATSPTMQRGYAEAVARAGKAPMVKVAFVNGAGHCTFTPAEHIAALQTLEARLTTGRWPALPRETPATSERGTTRFIPYRSTPPLRICVGNEPCR